MHWFWKWAATAFGPVLLLSWVLVQKVQPTPSPDVIAATTHATSTPPLSSSLTASRAVAAQPPPLRPVVAGHRFDPYVILPLAEYTAAALRIGDVTGDKRDDIVVVTQQWNGSPDDLKLIVYRQSATGTLLPPERYPLPVWTRRYGLALGDMDGDGVLDIVVGRGGGITIFTRDGSGFTGRPFETGLDADDVGVLDIDLDGKADVFAQTWWDGAVLFYGDGRGGIARTETIDTNGYGYNDLKVGDVNGDGTRDVVVSSGQGYPDFSYYPVAPQGGLQAGVVVPFPYQLDGAWGNVIADFTGDGAVDIVTSSNGNNTNPYNQPSINLFVGDGHGGFSVPRWYSTLDIPTSLDAADVDGNGLMDLVVRHYGWEHTGYYLQGPAGLEPERLLLAPRNSYRTASQDLSLGDLNSDGCKDIAFADEDGVVLNYGRNCRRIRTGGNQKP
jgi:hypothetical protein